MGPEEFDIFSEENLDIDIENLLKDPSFYKDIDVVVYSVINKSPKTIQPSIKYLQELQEPAEENNFPIA